MNSVIGVVMIIVINHCGIPELLLLTELEPQSGLHREFCKVEEVIDWSGKNRWS